MTRLLLAAAAAATFLCIASPAGAVVYVEGTGEPAFTNTTINTQWVRWQGSASYEQYRLEFDHYDNNALVKTEVTGNVAPNGSGTLWVNWAGIASPLLEGHTYTVCGYGRYWIGGIGSRDTGSCFDADQTGRRASTTIDRSKPSIAVKIDAGAAYSRTAKLNYNIDYSDSLAFPFPANFICRDVGGDPATACANATLQFNDACSVAVGGMKKATYFNCDEDLAAANIGDGPVTFCAVSADAAIPDNPNSANQGASAASANLSNRVCDSIVVDRTAPQASVAASSASVLTGDLVQFDASASDATSGVSGVYAWSYGDNTAAGSGQHSSHSFTSPGTYEVKVTTKDGAGNEVTAAKVVTVAARPAGGSGSTNGGGSGSTNGGGSGSNGSTEGGTGGGSGSAGGSGGLDVLAPKKLKLTARMISVALTAEVPGKATLALVRAGKVHATGSTLVAGTLGYKLRLPKKLKAGAYQLRISFTPNGATKATTKTVKITLTGPKKKAKARISAAPRISAAGAPSGVPTGRAPKAPASRHVHLPVG